MGIGYDSNENKKHNQAVLDSDIYIKNPPYSLDGYIERQELLGDLKFGVKDSAYGGCGWIAIWNVLKSANIVLNEAYLISLVEKHSLLSGLLGTKPTGITAVLKQLGRNVKMFANADAFIKSDPQKGIIYTMAQNFRAHYVGFNKVGETTDGEALYLFHNAGRRAPHEWASKNGKRYLCPKPQILSDYLARERDRCIILYNVK